MLTLVLLALSSTAVAAAASSQDCSLNGQWAGSECACDPPWTGETCGALKYKVGVQGGKGGGTRAVDRVLPAKAAGVMVAGGWKGMDGRHRLLACCRRAGGRM